MAETFGKIAVDVGLKSGDLKKLIKAENEIKSSIDSFNSAATKVGFDKKVQRDLERAADRAVDAMKKGAKAEADVRKEMRSADTAHKTLLSKMTSDGAIKQAKSDYEIKKAQLDIALDAAREIGAIEKKALDARIDDQMKAVKAQRELMKDSFSGALKDATKSIESKDLKGFGAAFSKMGGVASARGAAGEGASGKALAGLGKAASGIGAAAGSLAVAAATIAAVVGPLMLLAKIVFDADKRIKELNSSILETGGIADLSFSTGIEGSFEMADALKAARMAAEDFGNNMAWRTVAEEQVKIIAAFNEAGYALKEMTADADDTADAVTRIQTATAAALTYSKLLGVSETEMAGNIAEYMEELNQGLGEVQEGLSAVTTAASMSSFGTKRFYTMVQQATSGMSLYNVRMEEAASLLIMTSKALNPRLAGEFMQALAGGMGTMSMQDRIKEMMILGTAATKTMGRDAEIMAEDFADTFSSEVGGMRIEALKGKTGTELLEAIRGMSAADQRMAVAQLSSAEGTGREAASQFQKLIDLADATAAGATAGDRAVAAGQISMTGKLRLALQTFSGKPLSEMKAIDIMGHETMRGQSLEQIEQMRLIDRQLRGSHDELQAIAKIEKDTGIASAMTDKEMLAAYGAVVKDGKVYAGTLTGDLVTLGAEIGGDFDEYIMSQRALVDATEGAISEDQATAQDIARNTETIAKVLEAGTNQLLSWIGESVLGIWGNVTGKQGQEEALRSSQAALTEIADEFAASQSEVRALQHKKATSTDLTEQSALQVDIDAERSKQDALKIASAVEQAVQVAIRNGAMTRDTAMLQAFESGALEAVLPPEQFAELSSGFSAQVDPVEDALGPAASIFGKIVTGMFGSYELQKSAALHRDSGDEVATGEVSRADKAGHVEDLLGDLLGKSEEQVAEGVDTAKDTETIAEEGADTVAELESVDRRLSDLPADMTKEQKKEKAKELLAAMDITENVDALATRLAEGDESAKSQLLTQAGMRSDISEDMAAAISYFGGSTVEAKANDFIYRGGRGGGTLTPIDRYDELLGAKPGGPVAAAAAAGGGGGQTVNVNIYGGDTQELYRKLREWGVV